MSPPIELRQRSTLGVSFRTPLDVFGPGQAAPPRVDYQWVVDYANPFGQTQGYSDACQTGIITGSYALVGLKDVGSDNELPVGAEQGLITFTNQRSAEQILYTGPPDCLNMPGDGEVARLPSPSTFKPFVALVGWSGAGPFFQGTLTQEDLYDGWQTWVEGDPVLASVGYTPAPPKRQIAGTVGARDTVGTVTRVDYDDCSTGSLPGNSQRLVLNLNMDTLHPAVTESAFLAWRVVGASSGATMTIGEYAETHICGVWSAITGARYYRGARNQQPGNVYTHEYLSTLTDDNAATLTVLAAQAFGGSLPGFLTGESVTVTEP